MTHMTYKQCKRNADRLNQTILDKTGETVLTNMHIDGTICIDLVNKTVKEVGRKVLKVMRNMPMWTLDGIPHLTETHMYFDFKVGDRV